MDTPFPAYKGKDGYVFVCYAHKDARTVYADLELLSKHGVNIWYDEGIPAGASWRAEIAGAIDEASKFIFFISHASLSSAHCLREVDFAVDREVQIVPVYLDDAVLPRELELVLNRVQALFRRTDARYEAHLVEALGSVADPAAKRRSRLMRSPLPRTAMVLGGAALLIVAVAVAWFARDAWMPGGKAPTPLAAGPAGYDSYLRGMDLVARWDQDDNLEAAIAAFREAVKLDPGFALSHARLADALRMRHSLKSDEASLLEAAASAQEAMRLNAGLAPVQVAFGRVQLAQGNTDLALAALQRAIAIDPNNAAAHQAIATLYERLGRIEDAEASSLKAVALDPDSIPVKDSRANFLFRQGRFDEAADLWSTITRIAPDNFAALVNLGSALSQMGKVAESIAVYERAIALRPSYMAYSNLGTAYSRAQRYTEAAQAYRTALEIDDSDWLAWGNLAYVLSWMNGMDGEAVATFAEAIKRAEQARESNPRDAFANSDLALYYAKTGQRELALQRLGTALALTPDSSEILAAAAETHEQLGQRDEAVELAQRSLAQGYSRHQLMRNPELAELMADPRMEVSR